MGDEISDHRNWEEYQPKALADREDLHIDDETQAILEPLLYTAGEFSHWLGEKRQSELQRKMTLCSLGLIEPESFCTEANGLAVQALQDGYDAPFFAYLRGEECIDLVIHPLAIKLRALELSKRVDTFTPAQIEALRKWVNRGHAFFDAWLEEHPDEDRNGSLWLGAQFALDQLSAALHPVVA